MTLPQLFLRCMFAVAVFGAFCGYILFVLVRAQVRGLPGSLHTEEEIELDGDDEDLLP